jgi:hypothetical protein
MILVRNPDIEAAPLKDELLLYCSKTSKFFVMNDTAAFLWQKLQSPASEQELAEGLCAAFAPVSAEQAREDVQRAVKEMLANELIRTQDAPAAD